jgi:hypothetical protein
MKELMREHYTILAASAVNFRDRTFWAHQRKRLAELGLPLRRATLAKAIVIRSLDLLLNPKQTVEKLLKSAERSENGCQKNRGAN